MARLKDAFLKLVGEQLGSLVKQQQTTVFYKAEVPTFADDSDEMLQFELKLAAHGVSLKGYRQQLQVSFFF